MVKASPSMSTAEKLMTAEEFAARPAPCDDSREELVEGRVVVAPPPGAEHGGLVARLAGRLDIWASERKIGRATGESGYVIRRGPDSVRGPDVSFISAERLIDGRLPRTYLEGAPDLAVEIVSPGDRAGEINRKVAEYLESGAKRVWVVWPETQTVTIYRPDGTARTFGADDVLTSAEASFSVEGFILLVRDIFA